MTQAITIYTDGANSWENGSTGHAGIGVFITFNAHRLSISEYIGEATNNIAELKAIRAGLRQIRVRNIPVEIFTDSKYCIGVLTNQQWNPKANVGLIDEIRKLIAEFEDLQFHHVKGHAGVQGNEMADALAKAAKEAGQSGRPAEGVRTWDSYGSYGSYGV